MKLKIFRESFKGKSIGRTLLNLELKAYPHELNGDILDLGSGNGGSYLKFLRINGNVQKADLYPPPGGITVDLERQFPLLSRSFDYVLCFNLMEHIYNFQGLVSESYRVLKPGGVMMCSTPFLVHYHPDPKDYFRYSKEALKRIFEEAGFASHEVKYLGIGPFSLLSENMWPFVPRRLKPISVGLALFGDLFYRHKGRFALYYLVIARKGDK